MQRLRSAAMVAAVTIGALLASSSLSAQSSDIVKTKGLMFGLHLNGSSIAPEDQDDETSNTRKDRDSGGGAGAQIGWGFTKWFMLYTGVDAARLTINGITGVDDEDDGGEYTLTHLDVGARFSFPSPNHGFAPYLNVALTGRAAFGEVLNEDVTFSGGGATLGGGLMYFFNPKFALDIGLQVTTGKFDEIEVGGVKLDLDELGVDVEKTNSARINVGVKFFPHFGRK
jgi:hypothetical protein